MLFLIGLGLASEKDLSLRGIERLKECDEAYLEYYTGKQAYLNIKELEKLAKKRIPILSRDVIETDFINSRAKSKKVALLVVGDPLCATTHSEILLECLKSNTEYEVVHNASIISAVGETGLQVYKFGKTASIPFWQENFKPTSFIKVLEDNLKIGAHTLFLLDLNVSNDKFMGIKEALERVMISKRVNKKSRAVVISQLGSGKQEIVFASIGELLEREFAGPNAIIIPAKLHFNEEEILGFYK